MPVSVSQNGVPGHVWKRCDMGKPSHFGDHVVFRAHPRVLYSDAGTIKSLMYASVAMIMNLPHRPSAMETKGLRGYLALYGLDSSGLTNPLHTIQMLLPWTFSADCRVQMSAVNDFLEYANHFLP